MERTCVLLVCVLAAQDVDAKPYHAATSSRPCLHTPRRCCPRAPNRRHRGKRQHAVAAEEAVYTFTRRRRQAIAILELHAMLELWSTTEPCPRRRVQCRPWNREHQYACLHRTRSPSPHLAMATLPSPNPTVSTHPSLALAYQLFVEMPAPRDVLSLLSFCLSSRPSCRVRFLQDPNLAALPFPELRPSVLDHGHAHQMLDGMC
jgi:hypothetical protein